MSIIGPSLIWALPTGTIASGSVGYLRYAKSSEESVRIERLKIMYNVSIPPRAQAPPLIMNSTFRIGRPISWEKSTIQRLEVYLGPSSYLPYYGNTPALSIVRPRNNCLDDLILILPSDTGRSWPRKRHWPDDLLWRDNNRLTWVTSTCLSHNNARFTVTIDKNDATLTVINYYH
jgi:hypothetical protein